MRQTDYVSEEHRYGCHSRFVGEKQRGGVTEILGNGGTLLIQIDGHLLHVQEAVPIVTHWNPMACGHSLRLTDPACRGCVNRDRE